VCCFQCYFSLQLNAKREASNSVSGSDSGTRLLSEVILLTFLYLGGRICGCDNFISGKGLSFLPTHVHLDQNLFNLEVLHLCPTNNFVSYTDGVLYGQG
jgi:hypothetical protein